MSIELAISFAILCLVEASTTPLLYRTIEKTGFHRALVVRLDFPLENLQAQGRQCTLLFIEDIPSGAYVDPDQLETLRPYGGPDFYIRESVDVEKPEFESEQFEVLIFTNISHTETTLSCGYKLPIHLRYHGISMEHDYAEVVFPVPQVAVRCESQTSEYTGSTSSVRQALCSSGSQQMCDWTMIQASQASPDVRVAVPVGRKHHYYLVTIGTAVATVAGCVYLICSVTMSRDKVKVS